MFDWINNRTTDQSASDDMRQMETSFADVNMGLAASTLVATQHGWRAADAIAVGDEVMTFDNGSQKVVEIRRFTLWSTKHDTNPRRWPLHVPAGAMGNQNQMTLLPDQPVMIESDQADELYGDPFALLPAGALDGFRGIERMQPPCRTDVICLHFAEDQLVYTNGGALFLCQAAVDLVNCLSVSDSPYSALNEDQADILVSMMELDELGLRGAPSCMINA